jgi:propionate CoA-transferase
VLFVTERAVFKLGEQGLVLEEIAPGIDLEKDILALMDFKPIISESLKTMDSKLFYPELMELSDERNERCAAK